jgi:hypothetical protein
MADGQMRLVNTKTMASVVIPVDEEESFNLLDLRSGWIATASWTNDTGKPVTSFISTWTVPSEPYTNNDQTIYLFNGISPANKTKAILQPVLQWGQSKAGGGPYWSVASWYVIYDQAAYTDPVRVNVGDTLVGAITLIGTEGGKFNYECEFVGLAGTKLRMRDIEELVWCNVTLEALYMTDCKDYPASPSTVFNSINIKTGDKTPGVSWVVKDLVTDCGQQAVVLANTGEDGAIEIYFH